MRHHREPALHLIGPTWPTLAEALAAGAIVSAGNYGVRIGVSAGGYGTARRYSLAPIPNGTLIAWARADGRHEMVGGGATGPVAPAAGAGRRAGRRAGDGGRPPPRRPTAAAPGSPPPSPTRNH
jgi:hypothetical protein